MQSIAEYSPALCDDWARLEHRHLGKLPVRSGRVAVVDPFAPWDICVLEARIPEGMFDVVALVDDIDGEERVAHLVLKITDEAPTRISHLRRLDGLEHASVGVDTGSMGFIDGTTGEELETVMRADSERLIDEFLANGDSGWGSIQADLSPGYRLVACSSGWGDGMYEVYEGGSASDQRTCIFVDFQLHEIGPVEPAPSGSKRRWWPFGRRR